jgi:signal transduction histidine kinase
MLQLKDMLEDSKVSSNISQTHHTVALEHHRLKESNRSDITLTMKKKLVIMVEDTGDGIKKEDLTKLFKLFGKLDDDLKLNSNGTGLGLNITKRIVQTMGG